MTRPDTVEWGSGDHWCGTGDETRGPVDPRPGSVPALVVLGAVRLLGAHGPDGVATVPRLHHGPASGRRAPAQDGVAAPPVVALLPDLAPLRHAEVTRENESLSRMCLPQGGEPPKLT